MESLVGTVRILTEAEKETQTYESRRKYMQDIATYNEQIRSLKSQLEQKKQQLAQTTEKLIIAELELENIELRKIIRDLKKELEEKNG